MPTYTVVDPLQHNLKDYAPGDTVEMDEKQAAVLLSVAVVTPGKEEGGSLNATNAIAVVQSASTIEELEAMTAGETRKTVLAAIAARRKELAD